MDTISPLHVAAWLQDLKRRGASIPTIKQRLAGLRMLFQSLARERIVAVVKGPIENAARIAAHASTRATQLYDRRSDDITLDEIEKIRFS